ncbi:hypothetical protein AB8A28_19735 [Tardiphaga sp. 71_E8_N1_1]|uniref:hypothetical protein n=1 Tax=Tardiphaga sp. 71_E8_N1_1 TaxID=3240784 RepID=UPI003F8922BA
MSEASQAAYEKLLQRTDIDSRKKPAYPKRSVRDSDTRDPDRKGYYDLLKKVQRSHDATSLKSR